MNTKNTLSAIGIGLLMVAFSGVVNAAVPSPELQKKIHTERLQLETAKKESLIQCNQFKESAPNNYARCMSEHSGRFEAEIDMLMRNPDGYFARKQKVQNITIHK
jgi:gas vesicle protein